MSAYAIGAGFFARQLICMSVRSSAISPKHEINACSIDLGGRWVAVLKGGSRWWMQ
jgi:hypothetical protein